MTGYSSKNALLGGVLDYAGTFPPASLSFEDALRETVQIRRNARFPWLVGRVVLRVSDLHTLSSKLLFELGSDGTPWIFTLLGGSISEKMTIAETLKILESDLEQARMFNENGVHASCRRIIEAYEIKVPLSLLSSQAVSLLERVAATGLTTYFEIPVGSHVNEICDVFRNSRERRKVGIKVRTGGTEVPTAQLLAEFLCAVVSNGLKVKATQGLHYPVTRGKAFGFVNFFASLTFAERQGWNSELIRKCLEEEDPKAFSFKLDAFSWRSHRITCEELEASKASHQGAFGSCSFKEPDQFLEEVYP